MLIAAKPAAGLLTVVWLIGIYAILFGVMHLAMYFEAHSVSLVISHAQTDTSYGLNAIFEERCAPDPPSWRVDRECRVEVRGGDEDKELHDVTLRKSVQDGEIVYALDLESQQ